MRKLFLLIGTLVLVGCATPASNLNGTLTPPQGMAYVIVAVSGVSYEPDYTHLEVRYRSLKSEVKGSIHVNLFQDTIFGYPLGNMTPGKLALLRLPPGKYYFDGAYGNYMNPDEGGKVVSFPLSAEFTLGDGEVIYLGEIKLDLSLKPELTTSNQQTRDFAHIERIWQIKNLTPIKIKPI